MSDRTIFGGGGDPQQDFVWLIGQQTVTLPSNGSWTKIPMTVGEDTHGYWDDAGEQLVIPAGKAGLFLVNLMVTFNGLNITGWRKIRISHSNFPQLDNIGYMTPRDNLENSDPILEATFVGYYPEEFEIEIDAAAAFSGSPGDVIVRDIGTQLTLVRLGGGAQVGL